MKNPREIFDLFITYHTKVLYLVNDQLFVDEGSAKLYSNECKQEIKKLTEDSVMNEYIENSTPIIPVAKKTRKKK